MMESGYSLLTEQLTKGWHLCDPQLLSRFFYTQQNRNQAISCLHQMKYHQIIKLLQKRFSYLFIRNIDPLTDIPYIQALSIKQIKKQQIPQSLKQIERKQREINNIHIIFSNIFIQIFLISLIIILYYFFLLVFISIFGTSGWESFVFLIIMTVISIGYKKKVEDIFIQTIRQDDELDVEKQKIYLQLQKKQKKHRNLAFSLMILIPNLLYFLLIGQNHQIQTSTTPHFFIINRNLKDKVNSKCQINLLMDYFWIELLIFVLNIVFFTVNFIGCVDRHETRLNREKQMLYI